MSGKIKTVFMMIIFLILIFGILGESLGDVMTSAESVSDNSDMPSMIQLIFGYWWVPFLLLVLGIVLSSTGGLSSGAKKLGSRFKRRKR